MKLKMNNPLSEAVHKVKRAKAKLRSQKTRAEKQELVTKDGEKFIASCDVFTDLPKGQSALVNCDIVKVVSGKKESEEQT